LSLSHLSASRPERKIKKKKLRGGEQAHSEKKKKTRAASVGVDTKFKEKRKFQIISAGPGTEESLPASHLTLINTTPE